MNLKKPIHIIQVFDNSYEYGKNEKSYSDRKGKYKWKETIDSKSGIVENGILKINKEKIGLLNLNNINVILLIDYNSKSEIESLERFNYLDVINYGDYLRMGEFKKHKLFKEQINRIENIHKGEFKFSPLKWECFRFCKNEKISVELFWDYWGIGFPERENFKICDLEINKPIEININGKRDFSLTGRRARTFNERNFIIEYLGEICKYELIGDPSVVLKKEIPKKRKRINLLKELY